MVFIATSFDIRLLNEDCSEEKKIPRLEALDSICDSSKERPGNHFRYSITNRLKHHGTYLNDFLFQTWIKNLDVAEQAFAQQWAANSEFEHEAEEFQTKWNTLRQLLKPNNVWLGRERVPPLLFPSHPNSFPHPWESF